MVKYKITTPELVDFHFETAGLASRSLACVLDQVMIVVIIIGITTSLSSLAGLIGALSYQAITILVTFIVQFGYYMFFETRFLGQSPGKRVFGLRVVAGNGGRLSFADIFIRNILRAIDFFPVGYLIGLTVAFFDPYRRRLGDLAAGTLVVRNSQKQLANLPAAQRLRVNSFQDSPVIRNRILFRIQRAERDLVLDLMLRRDELDPNVRDELFKELANHLRERLSLPNDLDYLSDEQTVLNVGLVLQSETFQSGASLAEPKKRPPLVTT